jgi:DNA gyrase subunit A
VKLIDLRGNDEIAAVTKVKREDEDEEEVQYDEEGNPIVVEPAENETPAPEAPETPENTEE